MSKVSFGQGEEHFPVKGTSWSRGLSVTADPTWAKLVRTLVDRCQCLAEVVGQRVFGGQGVAAGVDLDGAVAA